MFGAATFSRFGFGGAPIGNLYRAVSESSAQAAVRAALELGIGFLDTAPYYGHGLSETRIGAALRDWRGPRPLLSSKVGRVLDPAPRGEQGDFGFADPMPFRPRFDYSRDGVRRSLEGSLSRLGVDKLDIALVHDISPAVHGEDYPRLLRQVLEETFPELERARSEGLVGAVGLGVNEWAPCVELASRTRLDYALLAGRYTLFEQPAHSAGALDALAEAGVQVLAAGVFNSGLMAQQPSSASAYNYAPASPETVERAARIWAICHSFALPAQAAALQFPLAHPAVRAIIVGARSAEEVAAQAQWLRQHLPDELWSALKQAGLLAVDAPTPKDPPCA